MNDTLPRDERGEEHLYQAYYSDYQHDALSVIVMPVKYLTNDLSVVRCYILRHPRGKKSGFLQFLRLGSPQQLFLSQKLFWIGFRV